MGAAAAIALIALSAAPASGGFRYVPPPEPELTQDEKSAPGETDIDPAPGSGPAVLDPSVSGTSVSGTSVSGTSVSGTSVWRVHEGERLRAVLARWAARAGSEVLFLTDRRYRLDGDAAFEGRVRGRGAGAVPEPVASPAPAGGRAIGGRDHPRREAPDAPFRRQ